MREYRFTLCYPGKPYERKIVVQAFDAADALVMMNVQMNALNRSEGEGSKWYITHMENVIPSVTVRGGCGE